MIPAKGKYDFENDIFYARPIKRVYESSFQAGNIIFDIDNDNKIVGFEILNASKVFDVPKRFLNNPKSFKIKILVTDSINLNISVTSVIRNSEKVSSLSVEKQKPDFLAESEMSMGIV